MSLAGGGEKRERKVSKSLDTYGKNEQETSTKNVNENMAH